MPSQTSWVLGAVKRLHGRYVFGRRIRVLAEVLAPLLPQSATVLDIGCGDGTLASFMVQHRPDISIQGLEIGIRPHCRIPVTAYDGINLPFADQSFDVCQFVDVLHHTENIPELLREACRVSRLYILLKDHLCKNALDRATLKFMDWVGNRPHHVNLPYNYQSEEVWKKYFGDCGVRLSTWTNNVPLYPFPASIIVGRGLHFVALLQKSSEATEISVLQK